MEEWMTLLGELSQLFGSAEGSLSELTNTFSSAEGVLVALASVFTSSAVVITAIVTLLTFVVQTVGATGAFAATVIAAVIGAVLSLVLYVLSVIPYLSLGKKTGTKPRWLILLPFWHTQISSFVLYRISGKESFELFNGKLRIQQGLWMFLAYILLSVFKGLIITTMGGLVDLAIYAISLIIPQIGVVLVPLSTLFGFIPGLVFLVVLGAFQYVYLRDAINAFKPDTKKNATHALVITVLDSVLTGGWATIIYLYSMMKLKPLSQVEVEPTESETQVEETVPQLEAPEIAEEDLVTVDA